MKNNYTNVEYAAEFKNNKDRNYDEAALKLIEERFYMAFYRFINATYIYGALPSDVRSLCESKDATKQSSLGVSWSDAWKDLSPIISDCINGIKVPNLVMTSSEVLKLYKMLMSYDVIKNLSRKLNVDLGAFKEDSFPVIKVAFTGGLDFYTELFDEETFNKALKRLDEKIEEKKLANVANAELKYRKRAPEFCFQFISNNYLEENKDKYSKDKILQFYKSVENGETQVYIMDADDCVVDMAPDSEEVNTKNSEDNDSNISRLRKSKSEAFNNRKDRMKVIEEAKRSLDEDNDNSMDGTILDEGDTIVDSADTTEVEETTTEIDNNTVTETSCGGEERYAENVEELSTSVEIEETSEYNEGLLESSEDTSCVVEEQYNGSVDNSYDEEDTEMSKNSFSEGAIKANIRIDDEDVVANSIIDNTKDIIDNTNKIVDNTTETKENTALMAESAIETTDVLDKIKEELNIGFTKLEETLKDLLVTTDTADNDNEKVEETYGDAKDYNLEMFKECVHGFDDSVDMLIAKLENKKALLITGAPGFGKTHLASNLAKLFIGSDDKSRLCMVQFSQDTSSNDFIGGSRVHSNTWNYEDGTFKKFCDRAKTDLDRDYVFIVDELNRANTESVFAEAFSCMEARGTEIITNEGHAFSVPNNLYIIATMNTYDQSAKKLDEATLSRFNTFNVDADTVSKVTVEDILKLNDERFGTSSASEESLKRVVNSFKETLTEVNEYLCKDVIKRDDNKIGLRILYTKYKDLNAFSAVADELVCTIKRKLCSGSLDDASAKSIKERTNKFIEEFNNANEIKISGKHIKKIEIN